MVQARTLEPADPYSGDGCDIKKKPNGLYIYRMPELSNIQTYEKLNGDDYLPVLGRFANVLKNIGVWNDEIARPFNNFKWQVEDDGRVYSLIDTTGYYASTFSPQARIRPLLQVFTPALNEAYAGNWIICNLLVEAEDLRNMKNGEYYDFVPELVKNLAGAMFKVFNAPVFFTDELQDARDIFGIVGEDGTLLWNFDYAMIPDQQSDLYAHPPKTHRVQVHDGFREAWYAARIAMR